MNIAHNHIVEKVFVEINTKDSELAFSLKNDVSEFLKNILIPKIENLFDNMFADGEIYRIEKVEINSPGAQVSLNESVADNVVDKIAAALRRTFETDSVAVQSKNLQLIASDLNNEQIFLSFIQMGSLPWHAGDFNMEEFQHSNSWNKILSDDKFVEKVKTVLKKEITGCYMQMQQKRNK